MVTTTTVLAFLCGLVLLANAEGEKKPCKTEDGKEVKVGEQYDKPGTCNANICQGDDVFTVAECGLVPSMRGWVPTPADPSKGFPDCCGGLLPPLEIVPDVLDKIDGFPEAIDVSYGDNATVDMGNELTPTQVKEQPSVNYTADPQSMYLLALVDPDAPSVINPESRSFLHWLVGNIPAGDVKSGEVLTEYVGSGPPEETGRHRYLFLVYKQPGKLTFDEAKISRTSKKGRKKFSVKVFAQKYKLEGPVGFNVFQAEYDDYVPELHRQFVEKEDNE